MDMSVPFTNVPGLFIGGEWVKATGGQDVIVNPATEVAIGSAPMGSKDDVNAAIAAARDAFDHGPWPLMSFDERAAVLRNFMAALQRRSKQVMALLTAEVGVTAMLLNGAQFGGAIAAAEYAIKLATRIEPEPLALEFKPNPYFAGRDIFATGVTVREPYGVVVGITPHNYPLLLNLAKAVPALLTGNTVVLKPSDTTPVTTVRLAELGTSTPGIGASG